MAPPETVGDGGSASLDDLPRNGERPAAEALSGRAPSTWGNPSGRTETEKPSEEKDSPTEPPLLQYLCVQSPAGKGAVAPESPGESRF